MAVYCLVASICRAKRGARIGSASIEFSHYWGHWGFCNGQSSTEVMRCEVQAWAGSQSVVSGCAETSRYVIPGSTGLGGSLHAGNVYGYCSVKQLSSGHMTPMFSDKSTFASTERVGQSLVDEIIARASPNDKETDGTRDAYNVNMGRVVGMRYDRTSTSSDKRVPTQWITMIVERSNCSSTWRANEVVTLYPDRKRP
jgi:hypothetical protein